MTAALDPQGRVVPAGELERRRAARAEQLPKALMARRVKPLPAASRRRNRGRELEWVDANRRFLGACSLKTGGHVVVLSDGSLARFRDGVDVEEVVERVAWEPEWVEHEPGVEKMLLPGGVVLEVRYQSPDFRWRVDVDGVLRAHGYAPSKPEARQAAEDALEGLDR